MANNITLFKKCTEKLDEVYKRASLTSALDSDAYLARAGANTNEIVIPKISMDALADYSRNSGYVSGDVELVMETVKFNYDRGRRFTVDAMDNEETAGLAFGALSSEFVRTRVVPELDAFRFATYAGTTGISTVDPAVLDTGEKVVAALRAATNKQDEDEVPTDNRILFITPTLKGMVEDLDTTKSREVMSRFASVVQIPQTRFYTAVDLKDGTSEGETAGGYTKATGAKDINFMILRRDAIMQYPKHVVNKMISPDLNQTSDGWIFAYRAYGLADTYENKVAGIYLHKKTT